MDSAPRCVARATHPSPPDLASVQRATRRAVAARCPALDNHPPYVQRPRKARPPHAPTADPAPPSCEPSPTTLAYSPLEKLREFLEYEGMRSKTGPRSFAEFERELHE